jgi:hypothetical protein
VIAEDRYKLIDVVHQQRFLFAKLGSLVPVES